MMAVEFLAHTVPIIAQSSSEAADLAEVLRTIEFSKLARALVIVALSYALNRLIKLGLGRLREQVPKRRLLIEKVSSFARLAVFIVGSYLAVATVLEDRASAAVGVTGMMAVALGFALKDTLSSVMAGVLILIDQPFQVGDRVTFGDHYGEIKEIGLRSVRMRTLEGLLVSIPNNKFLTDAVASATDGALDMMVEMEFHVAISEDADLVKRLVRRACLTSNYIFLAKSVSMRVKDQELGAAFVTTVKCKAYVIDARFEEAYRSDVTERVKTAFRRHQIQTPYARLYALPHEKQTRRPDR